jgi:hypothetical protein
MQRIAIGRQRSIEVQRWAGGEHSARATRRIADRSIELLRPFIEATIVEPGVSHDRALVIVLVDPAARDGTPFEEAILARYAFGRAGEVSVDYARHALDKARASYRERLDTSVLRERDAALLTADLPLVGGLHRRGWTVGVSGAAPAFDEAIGAIVIDLLHALQTHGASAGGQSLEERIA